MKSNISMIYHHHNKSKSARTRTRMRRRTGTEEESAITPALLAFLAVTFLLNTYNLRSRPWDIAFVAVTYSNLLLLFWCIETHHEAPEGSRRRKVLRAAVCFLSDTIIVAISYKVAGTMPLPVKLLVWAMAAATVSGITFGFIVYRPKPEDHNDNNDTTRTAPALEP